MSALFAFFAFSSRTRSPCATILSFSSTADPLATVPLLASIGFKGTLAVAAGAATTAPGFHSLPVADLYWAFRFNSSFTEASTSTFGAFLAFKSRTKLPCSTIFAFNASAPVPAGATDAAAAAAGAAACGCAGLVAPGFHSLPVTDLY
uniref:Putative secreted protein n=1 Tax=Anopheles marajoara TaxID=58244 RepID=A0A2M4C6F2_9DIPT